MAFSSSNQQFVYGTGPPTRGHKYPFVHGMRRSLNGFAILVSLFVPWLLFCTMFASRTFNLRYTNPYIVYVINFIGLAVVVAFGVLANVSIKRKMQQDAFREPNWYVFLFITCLMAWLLGIFFGDREFYKFMEPYYDVTNLYTYHRVDPAGRRGGQLMDAGRVFFVNSTRLDISRSMGFKNQALYCVAPIVTGNKVLKTYDFWAVGTDCCSGNAADFHCGQFNNPRAHAGLRLTRDEDRAFYRLAVQQAEAAYNIQTDHPLFFYWDEDPDAKIYDRYMRGIKEFIMGILCHLLAQFFFVLTATVAFSKLLHGIGS
mmetsp:Transcript_115410/g.203767  ORF Transcript_115410/g.203767 Transcript_115410/m.203767 type:complete len:315 (+) Transcript_115410:174-1118(+)